MKHVIRILLVFLLLISIGEGNAYAQKKNASRLKVSYFKDADQSERLEADLKVKIQKYVPMEHAMVRFYFMDDTLKVLLNEMETDENGKAGYTDFTRSEITTDTSGGMSFVVEYDGNDTIKSDEDKTSVVRASLGMSFFQKDSVKLIRVEALRLDGQGNFHPINGLGVDFFVKGTFSLLKIGKDKTNEKGIVELDFPVDMPGDTSGVLTIVAKVDDDKTFGTIQSNGEINWAVPIKPVTEKQRGLGDTDAPLWMVYTLITLLSIVWMHYLYVIFLIFKIKWTNN